MDIIQHNLSLSDNKNIIVFIERKKIKNYYIKISPDLKVIVSMPLKMDISIIYNFINDHKKWIEKNIAKFQSAKTLNIADNISNSGTVKILDNQYIVFIYKSAENKIIKDGFNIYIYSKKYQNLKYVKKQYVEYLKEFAKEYFEQTINKFLSVFQKYNIAKPVIKIKPMKSKWGSCIPRTGQITLNLFLIKASTECIDYVIFHELTHLLYSGHKNGFYNFLQKHMPNYIETEKKLDYETSQLLYQSL